MARGKRKAEASQSPPSKTTRRRLDVEDMGDDSASEGGEDAGRLESQEMLVVVDRLKYKDDGWLDKMRNQVDASDKALNDMLDDKERELADVDTQFHNSIRALLTDVLGGPGAKHRKKTAQQHANTRPAHDHAQLLFKKADDLIKYYKLTNEAIASGKKEIATEQSQQFEKDKNDVAELLHIGQEVARRRIQDILRRPDHDKTSPNKKEEAFSHERLDETANIFEALRNERHQQSEEEGEGVIKPDMTDAPGVYPLIHKAKKGVKKLAGRLLVEEEE